MPTHTHSETQCDIKQRGDELWADTEDIDCHRVRTKGLRTNCSTTNIENWRMFPEKSSVAGPP